MINFQSPLEAFQHWERMIPDAIFLRQPINGKLEDFSFKSAGDQIRRVASKIRSYDLSEGSHIALLSNNCAHWVMADLAIMMAGHVSIPIYPSLNDNSINQILLHSESKAIIIGKLGNFEAQKKGIPEIPKILVGRYGRIDTEGEDWDEVVKNHEPVKEVHQQKPDDLITIIYTSGTTGRPKGVMHTVGNFTQSSNTLKQLFALPAHLRLFSYLPLAHVAERLISNAGIMLGAEISFFESMESFASDLERTQPHVFFAVPRIWTKFQEKILMRIPQKKLDLLLKIPVLKTVIKNKLKHKLGLKQAVFICSAAAPISSSLIKWYETIGIIIHQGYGMTEDCCVSHFNVPNANKLGTVGKTLMTATAKLSPEGEILIKNKCLMKGYYKEPEMTAAIFDHDGYLKTGDIGEFDHDGYLTITGRVKDQFKTDKGKYILPSHIELLFSKNTDVEQICVVGTGIAQPIALVTLSELGKKRTKNELSLKFIESMENINPKLEKHEKLEKVVVMKEDWTVDNGLTTPTFKVKRNNIEKIHQPYYSKWFNMDDKIIFE